jgi:hypothetical protein
LGTLLRMRVPLPAAMMTISSGCAGAKDEGEEARVMEKSKNKWPHWAD